MRRTRAVAALAAIAWLGIAAAGALVVVAVFQREGISIGGNACGGAGASQVCRHIDRELALAELGWFSWATAGGGMLLMIAGIGGALKPGWRPILGLVALAVALLGLLGAGHLDNRFCPEATRLRRAAARWTRGARSCATRSSNCEPTSAPSSWAAPRGLAGPRSRKRKRWRHSAHARSTASCC